MPKGGVSLDEVADKDWMELTWRLAHHFPDEFVHVCQIVSGRHRNAETSVAAADEPGEPDGGRFSGQDEPGRPDAEESAL